MMLISVPKKKRIIGALLIIIRRVNDLYEANQAGGAAEHFLDLFATANCKVFQTVEASWTTPQTYVWNSVASLADYFDSVDNDPDLVDWDLMESDYLPDLEAQVGGL